MGGCGPQDYGLIDDITPTKAAFRTCQAQRSLSLTLSLSLSLSFCLFLSTFKVHQIIERIHPFKKQARAVESSCLQGEGSLPPYVSSSFQRSQNGSGRGESSPGLASDPEAQAARALRVTLIWVGAGLVLFILFYFMCFVCFVCFVLFCFSCFVLCCVCLWCLFVCLVTGRCATWKCIGLFLGIVLSESGNQRQPVSILVKLRM